MATFRFLANFRFLTLYEKSELVHNIKNVSILTGENQCEVTKTNIRHWCLKNTELTWENFSAGPGVNFLSTASHTEVLIQ